MGFPVRISITLDLILVTTREKVVENFFVHLFTIFWESITSKIFSALISTQKKKFFACHNSL